MKDKNYIHYRSNKLNPNANLVGDIFMNKPKGLWASPVDSNYGWKDFCISNDFRVESLDTYFTFKIKKDAKILKVKSHNDVAKYLTYYPYSDNKYRKPLNKLTLNDFSLINYRNYMIDFEKIYQKYDGMELYMTENYSEFYNSYLFNSYDVDSLIIWNLDKIIPIEN